MKKREDKIALPAFVLDIDLRDAEDLGVPDLVVDTDNGRHLYWFVSEAIS